MKYNNYSEIVSVQAFLARIKTFCRQQEADPFHCYKPMSIPPKEGKSLLLDVLRQNPKIISNFFLSFYGGTQCWLSHNRPFQFENVKRTFVNVSGKGKTLSLIQVA